MSASIRPGLRKGYDVFVNGRYWQWFPDYYQAHDECVANGYKVYG